jgi:hypothetical protein
MRALYSPAAARAEKATNQQKKCDLNLKIMEEYHA